MPHHALPGEPQRLTAARARVCEYVCDDNLLWARLVVDEPQLAATKSHRIPDGRTGRVRKQGCRKG